MGEEVGVREVSDFTHTHTHTHTHTITYIVPNEFLLFSVRYVEPYRSEIRMLSLNKDSSDSYIDTLVPIPLEGVKVNFLAFDHINLDQRLYWTEIEPPAIRSAFLNGSSRETFLDRSLQRPEGLAIDPYGKNLYWVDSRLDRVMVARLDNSSVRRVLVDTGLDHPRGIVLDLKNGYACVYIITYVHGRKRFT